LTPSGSLTRKTYLPGNLSARLLDGLFFSCIRLLLRKFGVFLILMLDSLPVLLWHRAELTLGCLLYDFVVSGPLRRFLLDSFCGCRCWTTCCPGLV
jgi:hypothetical protein